MPAPGLSVKESAVTLCIYKRAAVEFELPIQGVRKNMRWKGTYVLTDAHGVTDGPEIKVIPGRESALVCLSGSVDMESSPALRGKLLGIIDDCHTVAVDVDLSAVTHIDSSGIATLIEALRIARSKDTELRLLGLSGRLLQIFQITGLISLFNGGIRR